MDLQFVTVVAIVFVAGAFIVKSLVQKRRAFSRKRGCEADCGCGK